MKKFFKALVLAMILAGGFTIAQFDEPGSYQATYEGNITANTYTCLGTTGGCKL